MGREKKIPVNVIDERSYMLDVELVDSCCDEFREYWGLLFNWHDGDIYLFKADYYDGEVEFEPDRKIGFCPFCGTRIEAVKQNGKRT